MELTLSNPTKQNRKATFDALKLVAMAYICIGHVLQRWYTPDYTKTIAFALTYSVALGIFFFAGGYFIKRVETLKDLALYLLRLLLTYLLPAWLFTCASIEWLPRFTLVEKDFGFWMNELYFRTDTFYWYFLTAFFINAAVAIFNFVSTKVFRKKTLNHDVFRCLVVLALMGAYAMIFVYLYNNSYNQGVLCPGTLAANQFLYYAPIALVGFLFSIFKSYFKKEWKWVPWMRGSIFIVCLVVYILTLVTYPDWLKGLSGDFLTITWHVVGSLCGVVVYYEACQMVVQSRWITRVSKLGTYSGPFYLVHVFIIRLFATYISRPTVFDGPTNLFIAFLTMVFFFGSLAVTMILVKIPYTDIVLFGRINRFQDIMCQFRRPQQTPNE